ncbi:hypothetical protein [Allosphingosinicella vermicomposti]|uniref:hypothetical protein n=1 Tax=Allosphingosinicella vermicomposti TaxID=614671 RepID=UPI000D0EC94C|nr:hypothetical protein [Allosphingosinicella vermicomposti]
MRFKSALVAASLAAVLPATAPANPADALSLTRAGPAMEDDNRLTKGELYPLLGLIAVAVLALALLDGTTEPQEEPVSS